VSQAFTHPAILAVRRGIPIAWAALLLLHPGGDGTSIYADLEDNVARMLIVHIGMMIFIPLFAIAIVLLLRGIDSTAAQVARIALVPFVVLYVAWEALQESQMLCSSIRPNPFRPRSRQQRRT
jgi:hypothetical protein